MQIENLPLNIGAQLESRWDQPSHHYEVIGSQSPTSLAALIAGSSGQKSQRAHLCIFASEDLEQSFIDALHFFDPQNIIHSLPAFDVDPYSQLYPSRTNTGGRLHWLHRALYAKPGQIFTATIKGLVQLSMPSEVFMDLSFTVKTGEDLPSHFSQRLDRLGYTSSSVVEEFGQYALRGGIIDIFSPSSPQPYRLELFGDQVESVRLFDPQTQRSSTAGHKLEICPAREALYIENNFESLVEKLNSNLRSRPTQERDERELFHQLNQRAYFHGMEFLLDFFFDGLSRPIEYFLDPLNIWSLEPSEIARSYDEFIAELKASQLEANESLICPNITDLFSSYEDGFSIPNSTFFDVNKIRIHEHFDEEAATTKSLIDFRTTELTEFTNQIRALGTNSDTLSEFISTKFGEWRERAEKIFLCAPTFSQCQRLEALLERAGFIGQICSEDEFLWSMWLDAQAQDDRLIHIIPHLLPENIRFQEDKITFLRDEDFYGRKIHKKTSTPVEDFQSRSHALSFGDLKEGDYIVHKLHGVGVYGGLKVMAIQGVDSEFIQIDYKDKDRLYLPVYRIGQIQKFSGPRNPSALDKLGGQQWEKTKIKVKSHLRDLAAELLRLYAERSLIERPSFSEPDQDYLSFEASFPFDETKDQLKAVSDILSDMTSPRPMDRLICGDVGFGKTEVAMRAAFKAVQDGQQVAIIAPTTVLTFQHAETFKKRFKKWPVEIRSLNRFVPKKQISQTLGDLKEGRVDIVIGTHRLLSKDVHFKNLGLLIIDEEQKFGVRHKERLRKFKANVDTLAMSATPIPRTLNMSLVGIRDLSIINTPPVDRLPTRTFVCKFDRETIHRAVTNEVARGGQVFFIHNRVSSIYALADELREILPEVRLRIGHGQLDEKELESVMVAFFNHEIDVLLCTTIIESGMDIPKANTMFVDNSHQFGLSQLYQLRGRVGRSKERAYCYLLVPPHQRIDKEAQERLKVLQENTALGSGLKIAHYDLELRGSGDILGEQQSGNINAVGYELYLELLDDAVREAKGQPPKEDDVEPEINVRIPALIPDQYIPDIKVRLSYYKALSEIQEASDIDRIEEEMRDQFGKLPEQALNLLGLMLIRKLCKDLKVRDLSSGPKSISLTFTDKTPLPNSKVIELAGRPNKKYAVTPDFRLNIRINEITWPRIYDELNYLLSLCSV